MRGAPKGQKEVSWDTGVNLCVPADAYYAPLGFRAPRPRAHVVVGLTPAFIETAVHVCNCSVRSVRSVLKIS